MQIARSGRRRRAAVLGIPLAWSLLLAGCSQGAASAPTVVPAKAGGVVIRMLSEGEPRVFEPAAVTVPKGATVTWQHVSGSGHSTTADPARVQDKSHVELPTGAEPWDSGTLSDGKTFSRTFDVPGTYRYVCVPHEGRGMLGTITVTP